MPVLASVLPILYFRRDCVLGFTTTEDKDCADCYAQSAQTDAGAILLIVSSALYMACFLAELLVACLARVACRCSVVYTANHAI